MERREYRFHSEVEPDNLLQDVLPQHKDYFRLIGTADIGEGLPCGPDSKESACNAGDLRSTPRSRRSPGEGNGNPLQYSFLENSMDKGAWWATVHVVANSQIQLSN